MPAELPSTWMLYLDGPALGPYNMAKDAYCLERAVALGCPALRLYRWSRMTMSVGRTQKVEREIDLAACRREGIDMVRRETGGRAVLHGSDLTYSLSAPLRPPFKGGVMDIYREVSRVFVRFFTGLGKSPQVKEYTTRERADQASPICFSTPSAFEILLDGKKIVGSAQRLQTAGVLQHGSIPLAPQEELLARLFLGASAGDISAQMTDLHNQGIMPGLGLDELQNRLVAAWAEIMGVSFQDAPWDERDEQAVRKLESRFPLMDYPS